MTHTLVMSTTETEAELTRRTLEAARAITQAAIAAVLAPDGGIWTDGDPALAERLHQLDPATRQLLRHPPRAVTDPATSRGGAQESLTAGPDGHTLRGTALAALGLAVALTATVPTPNGDAVLVVADRPGAWFDPSASELLALVAAHAAVNHERLRRLDQLRHHANSDPLTGLNHHRPFGERLEAAAAGRTALLAIDVDGFKAINDQLGHQAGDHLLIKLVTALQSALRQGDELYRIGGDEFAVMLDVNAPTEAIAVAGRLLQAARESGHTISVGVALTEAGEHGQETLRRADLALLDAKRAGRDRVRLA
jgi:diguanylate cyclase (GGDEF)-like protein